MLASRYSLTRTARTFWALLTVFTAVVLSRLMQPHFDEASIAMVYMLAVVVVAVALGLWPAVATCLLGVLVFDYINVSPHFEFARREWEHLFTFGVMLATAVLISWLTRTVRLQAELAAAREESDALLFSLAEELAGEMTVDQIIVATGRHMGRVSQLHDGADSERRLQAMARLAEQALERRALRERALS